MGVIKNFPYGRTPPILRSSGESLVSSAEVSIPSTPPSETEESHPDQGSESHSNQGSESHSNQGSESHSNQRSYRSLNPRRRDPTLLLQRLEALTKRSRTGARKARREDNARALQTLVEYDEGTNVAQTPSIEDFISKTETPLSKLITDFDSMKIWEYFMSQSEEEQRKYLEDVSQNKRPNHNSAKYGIYFTQSPSSKENDDDKESMPRVPSLSAAYRFSCIEASLRNVLKRRNMPNGLLINLEDDLVDVYCKDASAVYMSRELNSFERLLLHAISQYYHLKSCSITVAGSRRTRVKNKIGVFSSPSSTLTNFLDERNKSLNRS